jgi:hypothetical protein
MWYLSLMFALNFYNTYFLSWVFWKLFDYLMLYQLVTLLLTSKFRYLLLEETIALIEIDLHCLLKK